MNMVQELYPARWGSKHGTAAGRQPASNLPSPYETGLVCATASVNQRLRNCVCAVQLCVRNSQLQDLHLSTQHTSKLKPSVTLLRLGITACHRVTTEAVLQALHIGNRIRRLAVLLTKAARGEVLSHIMWCPTPV
jgi:hypothetical protein